jgi:alkylhydroperoxidase family enzyme
MGHSQMLLAVAGLTEEEIKTRAAALADGDWSEFSPSEQVALRFTSRLTAEPWAVTSADVDALVGAFGRARALDVIYHVAWGNYMTRVAEALQLPLETTNVFEKTEPPKS